MDGRGAEEIFGGFVSLFFFEFLSLCQVLKSLTLVGCVFGPFSSQNGLAGGQANLRLSLWVA